MKDEDVVVFTVGDLRRLAETCPEVKRALEKAKPEVFKETKAFPDELKEGMVFIGNHSSLPYFAIEGVEERWKLYRPYYGKEDWRTIQALQTINPGYRPMRSGTITITVKNGRADGVTVDEE